MNDQASAPEEGLWLRRIGAVAWPSFLAAAAANAAFFSLIDPIELGHISFPDWAVSRELGYTVGFFMFWAVCAGSSAITAFMLETPAPKPPKRFDPE